jgi:hypothetical protein
MTTLLPPRRVTPGPGKNIFIVTGHRWPAWPLHAILTLALVPEIVILGIVALPNPPTGSAVTEPAPELESCPESPP